MNAYKFPVNSILLFFARVALLLPFSLAYGQSATLDVDTLKLPAVKVGEAIFSVDLTLVPGSAPITSDLVLGSAPFTFNLTAAGEAPNADLAGASSFEGATLTVPSLQIDGSSFLLRLILSNAAPVQFQLTEFSKSGEASSSVLSFFESSVSPQIVDSRCVTCHVDGGIASSTSLVFQRSSNSSVATNFAVFDSFRNSRSDALDYILNKASGSVAHGGGTQLAVGSTDYNNLQSFLSGLISGNGATVSSGSSTFFTGVENLNSAQTLRRAAIILAGRAPSTTEITAVENGDESALRNAIRSLMVGDNFHEFLLEGANDRLLVRGTVDTTFLDGGGLFPNFTNTWTDLALASFAERGSLDDLKTGAFLQGVDLGLRDSPLELIAYVVENDKPYSEILTADYMMTNSIAAFAMNGTGSFSDPEDNSDFQPVTLDNYYAYSENTLVELLDETQRTRVTNPGSLTYDFPHAGILNTQSYLFRYPTTATNRNRARSRWTFMNFLDTDIEASAPRTTDAVALADNNNPTMFNSNCTVCHATLDPMAGAFQNYGDEGHFLVNSIDSLDNFYKYPEDGNTPYQHGDKWYRDMRAPGFVGETAPSSDNSLQWVAQKIVEDPRFARATVKFWWPAVIGTELLAQPEVQTDVNYASKLMAYDAQAATIQSLADGFVSGGMNLKDMLVNMTMTSWFRADGVSDADLDPVEAEAHSIANLGSERLLSPEQLSRKTRSLTGFTWRHSKDFLKNSGFSGLKNEYQLYYGGIDSDGVTKRSTVMTALMSTVAMTHASESSCPIVLREFALPAGSRALFNGLDSSVTPLMIDFKAVDLATTSNEKYVQTAATITLDSGTKDLYVSLNNGWCDWNQTTEQCDSVSRMELQDLEIQMPNGTVSKIMPNPSNSTISSDCAWYHENGVGLCNTSKVVIPFTPTVAGEYKLTATIWPLIEGADHPRAQSVNVSIGAESSEAAVASTAPGALQIKQKLVELHQTLHGKSFTVSSPEIELAYQLYAESWDEIRNLPNAAEYANINWAPDLSCPKWEDYELGVGLSPDITPYEIAYNDWGVGPDPYYRQTQALDEYLNEAGADPLHSKRAWITVMTYMLSHYDYLYE